MKRWIYGLLVPPVFDDEAKTALTRQVYRILHAVIVLSGVFFVPFALFPEVLSSRFTTIVAIIIPLALLLLEIARRGWVRLASIGLITTLWAIVTIGAATAGGVRAPIFMGYLVIIVVGGLLMGKTALFFVSILSMMSGLGLAYAEEKNILPASTIHYTPYAIFFIYSFFGLSVLVLQHITWQANQSNISALQTELKERNEAEKKLKQRAYEMFLLYKMSKAITSGENLYQALRALVIELKSLIQVDAFYVGLYDDTTHLMSFPLYISRDQEVSISPRNLVQQPGLTAHVIHTRQTLYLPDVQSPEVLQRFKIVVIADPDIRTYLGIPLINEGRILGVMSVQAREPNTYSEDQIRLLETLASQAAIAVEKYELLRQLQKELAERKQVEGALRESEARLQSIIAQFPYDLWVCDAESRYIIVSGRNRGNYSTSLGKTALELDDMPLELRQEWQAEHERVLRGETIYKGPFDVIADGKRKSYIVTLAPIVMDEQIIGLTGLRIDVTELRRAEEETRQLNEQLEQRVIERTAALEQANREMQAFSYSISHDLRSPLRAIRGFGQILRNEFGNQLDTEGKNYLERVLQAAEEMNALIDSLLALFRLSKADLHRQKLDLSAEARSIVETLRQAEPNRAVTCHVMEGLFAHADPSLMRNVLENLLGNAWKYSAKTPEAIIEFGAETKDGEIVYFVRDNGAGFDMQYADKLFQPFQRLHRAEDYPGHGIGLATVQRIIQRHGGRIWAESSPGQGATFYFTLSET
ncbi:MAG: hypothetical protein DDG60_13725 [Anaerolineae bacterium]|nr:MAG: hypothetical protein DDG60_13725 [Anaerolineae bacterium]